MEDVSVVDGLFKVVVDFGEGAFDGEKRWLEVGFREGGHTDGFTLLEPRQELTAVPHSVLSQKAPWSGVTDKPEGFADDIDDDTLGGLSCADGQVPLWDGFGWTCGETGGTGDITGVAAGPGLTGGGTSGDVTLGVSFAGSGLAPTASRSDHNHAGQTWSGTGLGLRVSGVIGLIATGGNGVQGISSTPSGVGIVGLNTGSNGIGISGSGTGTGSIGVRGSATALGVLGDASSSNGIGVLGRASSSSSGTGVVGLANSSTGSTRGLWARVDRSLDEASRASRAPRPAPLAGFADKAPRRPTKACKESPPARAATTSASTASPPPRVA